MTDPVLLLLAEDEPTILMMVEESLEEAGYSVTSATSGDQAMAAIEDKHENLLGLVTDIRIGSGPDGWELARRARELNPSIAVVYMTGDSAHEWAAQGVPKSVLLQKPFANAQLVTAISNLLNEAVISDITAARPEPD